jgi:hypothetical protein
MSDSLYGQWRKLGLLFSVEQSRGPVFPENLIAQTTHSGRSEARLFWGMLTWIIKYGDLINGARLFSALDQADGAVLGAVLSVAHQKGADPKLRNILAKCRPKAVPEILFHSMAAMKVTSQHETDNGLPEFREWGLLCSTARVLDDAVEPRGTVLARNRNLALRAAFGPGIRSDLLFCLQQRPRLSIRGFSQALGLSYQPVYAEAQKLVKNGIVLSEKIGNLRVLSLTDRSRGFLSALPV